MNDTIVYEQRGQRQLDLSLMIRLYNHQCVSIGMNQILNTYMVSDSKEFKYFGHNIDATGNEILEALSIQF